MEEQYWKQFAKTGKVDDYLYYKGIALCARIMEHREEEKDSESNHRDRDDTSFRTNW